MTRTFEIIRDIVDSLDLTTTVEVDGNLLTTCKTLHVRKHSIVKDGANNTFKVTDFVNNESITVEPLGSYTWSGTVLTAPKPLFIQGKSMSTNEEYLDISNATRDKTPLIWLVRGYREKHYGKLEALSFSVEPLIYFLDEAYSEKWLNDEHDINAINPMYNLCQLFVNKVKKSNAFNDLVDYSIDDEPRFGVRYSAEKGNRKRIIDDDLSGVGLRIPLDVRQNCKIC